MTGMGQRDKQTCETGDFIFAGLSNDTGQISSEKPLYIAAGCVVSMALVCDLFCLSDIACDQNARFMDWSLCNRSFALRMIQFAWENYNLRDAPFPEYAKMIKF